MTKGFELNPTMSIQGWREQADRAYVDKSIPERRYAIWRELGMPEKPPPPLPEKPSIAVLPFKNFSGDAAQDWIGDGLTGNIIVELATSPDLFIIARNSSFRLKGKEIDEKRVGREFGVRYVLTGTVQRQGERLRVTARLTDTVEDKHVWLERFDRRMDDLFAVQDEITARILEKLQVELTLGEQARYWRRELGDIDTFRKFVEGRVHYLKYSAEAHFKAEELWSSIYRDRPDTAIGNRLMGWLHWNRIFVGISKNAKQEMAAARKYGEASLAINAEDSNTHALLGTLDMYSLRHDSALRHAERALELLPSGANTVHAAAFVKAFSGRPREAIHLMKQVMRLEPYYSITTPNIMGWCYLMLGDFEQARRQFEAVLTAPEENVVIRDIARRSLIVALLWLGETEMARDMAREHFKASPKLTAPYVRARGYYVRDQDFMKRFADALVAIGLPEK